MVISENIPCRETYDEKFLYGIHILLTFQIFLNTKNRFHFLT